MAANLQIEACIPTFQQCKNQLALLAAQLALQEFEGGQKWEELASQLEVGQAEELILFTIMF